ncbi:30S ribosomal protein S9 [Microgenomates bacterium UTCPR1]|nr:MAG: 30S ribosomal protein S9 [Microgenomates bacterium UTCPR1]
MAKKTKNLEYYEAVGRRKTSVARVRLYLTGKDKTTVVNGQKLKAGEVVINKKPLEKIFTEEYKRNFITSPLKALNSEERFVVSIITKGGGKNGQLEAVVHGISRALVLADEGNKTSLKKLGLLTRDPRKKERRKVGTGGKARRTKQSPKR